MKNGLPVVDDSRFHSGLQAFKTQLAGLEAEIPCDKIPVKSDAFHAKVLEAFEASQTVCREFETVLGTDESAVRAVQEYFRKETDPWMRLSWFGDRARSKPSGFAGDYEMLIKLYDGKTPATGLGGYIDLCLVDLPLARAVRARLKAAKAFLIDEIERRRTGVRILDIASGPGREFHDWPQLPKENPIEVIAIDNDPVAIQHVQQHVIPRIQGGTKLDVVRYNALRTRNSKATVEKFGRFDIIYSVGLFDYLTDDHLIGMFSGLRDSLNNNGVMYIAFKDTEQYDKTPYQWHLDWFFYQRTEQDVLNIYERAGFAVEEMETTRDATGIIINFISRHTSSHIQRLDSAESVRKPTAVPNEALTPDEVN
jgi:extracellular factor (EF) 3-hydroxypalmitic acid methyl ester biosynthesis protein